MTDQKIMEDGPIPSNEPNDFLDPNNIVAISGGLISAINYNPRIDSVFIPRSPINEFTVYPETSYDEYNTSELKVRLKSNGTIRIISVKQNNNDHIITISPDENNEYLLDNVIIEKLPNKQRTTKSDKTKYSNCIRIEQNRILSSIDIVAGGSQIINEYKNLWRSYKNIYNTISDSERKYIFDIIKFVRSQKIASAEQEEVDGNLSYPGVYSLIQSALEDILSNARKL
jgi:hypothetical protein